MIGSHSGFVEQIRHPEASGWTAMPQVGRQEPVMVLRVDKEKGYIDLSKRRVAAEDIQVTQPGTTSSSFIV